MTDLADPSEGSTDGADDRRGGHKLLVAAAIALLLALGLSLLIAWWRRGGPRKVITELAEEGAVRLADKVVDEVLGTAA